MPKGSNAPDSGRRNFLKGATFAGAAALASPVAASTQASDPPKGSSKAAVPGPRLAAAETMPPSKDPVSQTTSGGDFMVDVFKTLD
ncbi:MAG: twin-arginine translocation signal domain-containing protein, partial [Pseudolabrys sp.]